MRKYWPWVVIGLLVLNTIFIVVFSNIRIGYLQKELDQEVKFRKEAQQKQRLMEEEAVKLAAEGSKLRNQLAQCESGK